MLPVQGLLHISIRVSQAVFIDIPSVSLGLSLCRNLYHTDSTSTISIPTLQVVIRVMIFSFLTLVAFAYVLPPIPTNHA